METIWQDIRYGFRMLAKGPGFALVAVLTLALGIGANTAIFSVVNAVLLRPLPYPEPDRLIMLWSTLISQGTPLSGSALPDYREWRDQSTVFEGLAGMYYSDFNLTGQNQEPERVQGARVTPNFLSVLGATPLRGRSFLPKEDQYGEHHVVILSHGLWQRRYGGDPNILNRQISVGGQSYTVVGILPEGMPFLDNLPPVELLAPISFPPGDNMDSRNNHFVPLVGRLKPGVSLEQAQTEVSAIAKRLEQQFPENSGLGARLVPLDEQLVGDSRGALLLLLGAVAFVLLITCVNVANLLLARAAARERELAIRASLGAGRARLLRQMLVESVPLALLGGAAGLLLAVWGVDALVPILPVVLPRFNPITMDAAVFAFAGGISIFTVLLFGLAPAWQASRAYLHEALSEGGRSSTAGCRRHRLLSILVASEMALALVLLAGAGLMLQSLWRLQKVDSTFSPEHVLTMSIPLPGSKYATDPVARTFFEDLIQRVSALPGVQAVGVSTTLPLGFGVGWGKSFSVEGRPVPPSVDKVPSVNFALVSSGYFRAAGIPLSQGRGFAEQDSADAQQVAIINETLARRFFPDEDPLGKVIYMGTPESLLPPPTGPELSGRFIRRTIVGVIADVKDAGLNRPVNPTVFVPYTQSRGEGWFNTMALAVRNSAAPKGMVPAVLSQIRAIDPQQPVTRVATLEELISRSLSQSRFSTLLLGLFAMVAMLLAAVGIYGVMAYSVAQRSHEFGIRIALGAQPSHVRRLVLGRGFRVALVGVVVGLVAAVGLTRLLSSQLYGISTTDPLTFAGVALLLTSVALAACYIPARRAMKVDPMVALRYE